MLNAHAGVRSIATRSRRCRLRARGDFDRDNCVLLIEAVLAALPEKPATITIDARDVTFADAAVVSALLYCRDLAAQSACTLRIVHATGVFAHVLRVTGVWPELCLLSRVV